MSNISGRPRGRPPGSKNKRTLAAIDAGKKAVEAALADAPDVFDGDAHAFLVSVYRDKRHPMDVRLDAAKAAMTREKPALAAIDVTSQNEHVVHTISDQPVTAEEWAEQHATVQ